MIFDVPSLTGRSQIRLRPIAAVVALCLILHGVAFAGPPRPMDAGKLKGALMKRGVGMGFWSREVDGTTVTGVLTAIHDDSFEVTPRATLVSISIPDNVVESVHADEGIGTVASGVGRGFEVVGVTIGAVALIYLIRAMAN